MFDAEKGLIAHSRKPLMRAVEQEMPWPRIADRGSEASDAAIDRILS